MENLTEEQLKEYFITQRQDVIDAVSKRLEEWSANAGKQLETYCEHTNKAVTSMSDTLALFQTRLREFEGRLSKLERDFKQYQVEHSVPDGEFWGLQHDYYTFADSFKNDFERNLENILVREGFILGKVPEGPSEEAPLF